MTSTEQPPTMSDVQPGWVRHHGVQLPLDPERLPHGAAGALRRGSWKRAELAALRQLLHPGARVVELGSSAGLIASIASAIPDVTTHVIDSDPAQLDLAREVTRAHGASGVSFTHLPNPLVGLGALMDRIQPTHLICDLDAALADPLAGGVPDSLQAIILTLPPRVPGSPAEARLIGTIAARGFQHIDPPTPGSRLHVLHRAMTGEHPFPPRAFRPWPHAEPRIFVPICMKNEGPWILEWLAWQKALGVTDIVVFTNHCSDGSERLLERLDAMGHLRHLPNPGQITSSAALQPLALAYAGFLPQMRDADYVFSTDVDEFLNIRVGDGSLKALFEASGAFDVLSISEVNHGSNGHQAFTRGWLMDLNPAHQTTTPGKARARRGVKSITRLSPRIAALRNHRPDLRQDVGPVLWRDGSGRVTSHFHEDRAENGHDARGSFDLVRLEHFPLRSLDSYLGKMARGDAVTEGKRVSRAYWRIRNKHDERSMQAPEQLARAREWYARHLASDPELMALHEACCQAHETRIDALMHDPAFRERREWVLREAWDDVTPPDMPAWPASLAAGESADRATTGRAVDTRSARAKAPRQPRKTKPKV